MSLTRSESESLDSRSLVETELDLVIESDLDIPPPMPLPLDTVFDRERPIFRVGAGGGGSTSSAIELNRDERCCISNCCLRALTRVVFSFFKD